MSQLDDLVNQHIREYESRLKHIDELFAKAKEELVENNKDSEIKAKFEDLLRQRNDLAKPLDAYPSIDAKNWRKEEISTAGPLSPWVVIAEQLENLIERFEKK